MCSIAPRVIRADTPAEAKARRLFETGNEAFIQGRYADALGSYRASFALVERPRTLFNIATCHDRLGDLETAYVEYKRFLAIAQQRDHDLVVKTTERLAELDATLRVPVPVASSPPGAAVYLDDEVELLARTPATIKLSLGEHRLRFEVAGHKTTTEELVVVAGERARVDIALDPLAAITITAEPADAVIRVEGAAVEPAAGALTATVDAGTYTIEVTHPQRQPQRIEVRVVDGATITRHVVLEPLGAPGPGARDSSPDRAGRGIRLGGLIVGGVGAASLAAGAASGVMASVYSGKVQQSADDGEWDGERYDQARSHQKRMFVFYGIGGAAVATGIVLYYVGHRARSRAEERADGGVMSRIDLAPTLAPDGAGFAITGRF